MNTIYVWEKPDTGKSQVVNSIVQSMLFHGDVLSSDQFGFQELGGKVVSHISEVDPKTLKGECCHHLKHLMEGEPFTANRKHGVAFIDSMPVFMTSNHPPEEVFKAITKKLGSGDSYAALMRRTMIFHFQSQYNSEKQDLHPKAIVECINESDERFARAPDMRAVHPVTVNPDGTVSQPPALIPMAENFMDYVLYGAGADAFNIM